MKRLLIGLLVLGSISAFSVQKQCDVLLEAESFDGSYWEEEVLDIKVVASALEEQGFNVVFAMNEYKSLPLDRPKFSLSESRKEHLYLGYLKAGIRLDYGWANQALISSNFGPDSIIGEKGKYKKINNFIRNKMKSCDHVLKIFRSTFINTYNW